MSEQSRPVSRWSNSMSVATKATACTNQTIPLMNIRRKLFRNSTNNQRTYAQRLAKSKRDIEELFRLYYSNDIKFDTIHRQIVTGTRIPTARAAPPPAPSNELTSDSSTNMFSSKHCVSREQMSNNEIGGNETTTATTMTTTTTGTKSAPLRRTRIIRTENQLILDSPTPVNNPPINVTPVISNQTIISPNKQQEELLDSVLVKSVTFAEEISNENLNTDSNKINNSPRSKSSLLTIPSAPAPPPPSMLSMNSSNRKDPSVLSQTTFLTNNSVQPQTPKPPPAVVTGSAVVVRSRSPGKLLRNRNRPKTTMTTTTTATTSTLAQSLRQLHSPSIISPLSIHPDAPELPVFTGPQRVVSIPSRCSRYVLVTFPEAPLRYNAPSYVERLLLPERFPTLFQNIVQSYDHYRETK